MESEGIASPSRLHTIHLLVLLFAPLVMAYELAISLLQLPLAMIVSAVIAVPLVILLFRHPTVTYVLFVFAGQIKAIPWFEHLPDLTLSFAAIVGTLVIVRAFQSRNKFRVPFEGILLFALAVLMVVGLIYTPAFAAGLEKTLRFLVLSLLAGVAPFVLFRDKESLRSVFVMLWILAVIGSIHGLIHFDDPLSERVQVLSAGQTSTGRMMALGTFSAIFVFMQSPARLRRLLGFLSLPLFVGALIGAGSRGPFYSVIVTLLLAGLLALIRRQARLHSVLAAMLGVVAFGRWILHQYGQARPVERLLSFLYAIRAGTIIARPRLEMFEYALRLFFQHPVLGVGVAGYSLVWGGSIFTYPHNAFLEVASELGLFGLIIFAALIITTYKKVMQLLFEGTAVESRELPLALFCGLVFSTLGAMVSGSLNSHRDLWMFIGLVSVSFEILVGPAARLDTSPARSNGGERARA